ncbi:MaoC/PaaZ C-terminal domain-containing protein [Microbulbifer bruguierae]|uniref:MaoC/PaaZ C-terminal domain-containing protein n=1 Tax=Microbulbifer bruguierae TaxID=3029061 RepID=A0ABY8NGC0_9GAMM|nr:MaoC/PaaZ C-terminal domain-containing protein [Microbulbifer bruguierae]WGL17495.1 MaoC/PaaZ C-terminal domain-containing protein [Microbulbifer bruguierae]
MYRIVTVSGEANRVMPLQIKLKSRPAILPLYLRALTARKQGRLAGEGGRILASVSLNNQAVDPISLRAYREVCGFADGSQLPATYPFVLAMPLQLRLLVSEAFPFPVLGVVHLRNRIRQYRGLQESERLDIRCDLCAPVAVKRGYEFELVTSIRVAGELVWESTSTLMSRVKHQDTQTLRTPAATQRGGGKSDVADTVSQDWQVAADTGRRYARISGDRNPIHLCAPTAKLFGFPRAIAHGMWSKARCLAALEEGVFAGKLPTQFEVEVAFIKPIFLPARVSFESSTDTDGTVFQVYSGEGKRVHLTGKLVALREV